LGVTDAIKRDRFGKGSKGVGRPKNFAKDETQTSPHGKEKGPPKKRGTADKN